jgi:hypothetical protein
MNFDLSSIDLMKVQQFPVVADWLPANATWHGKPDGAGPDDNGTY